MGDNNKKIVNVCLVIAGFMAFLVTNVILGTLVKSGVLGLRGDAAFWVDHVVPMAAGVGTWAWLQFNPKTVAWAEEVVVEISKVVWPTRQQTIGMTIVVCVMVVISGLILGFLDIASGQAITAGILKLKEMF